MLQIITTEFIERFSALNNVIADVYIKHILYGCQKIKKCILHPVMDGERIGLSINGEDIYITMDELCEVNIDDKECCIKSELMELCINYFLL